MKIKTILISQPEPSNGNSPYSKLKEKHNLSIDFRQFIHVEGLSSKQVREQKIDFSNFDSIILTSRNSVDHFFRLSEEMRYKVPDSTKYFCQSEAVAFYLQKYVVYRKRKIYVGKNTLNDLDHVFKKFSNERYLLPSSDVLKKEIPDYLDSIKINWKRARFYNTVISDLSDLRNVYYDMLVFFSPSGIDSLFKNFPDFQQKLTKIAVYGTTTQKAAIKANLRIDVKAPSKEYPSMSMALEKYINSIKK
tara:strand:+ start:423 stop:1166 length:744 start_codon:yes stop_codon:yes gene_type:complete